MKRQRKHFLGILGIFIVTAVTTYAHSLPIQDTSATGNNVTISVTVTNPNPAVNIVYPNNGDSFEQEDVDVVLDLIPDKKIIVVLTNLDTGEKFTFNYNPKDESYTETIALNLSDYGGNGLYKIDVKALNDDDTVFSEDTVSFEYTEPVTPPDIPNTGSFLKDLNLSSADYIFAGIAALFIITAGFILLRKKSDR